MPRPRDWLARSEVYGEGIRDLIQLGRYRFDFVTHTPRDRDWMQRLRGLGGLSIPYVTMYQQPISHTYQGIDLRQHTDWIELDEDGNWKRTSFWESEDQKNWYVMCPNAEGYVEALLGYVGSLMEAGAGGVFVDNVGGRKRCYGPEFGIHTHQYENQVAAFSALLGRVREVIKQHDPDGILLINSASPETLPDEYWIHADADMAESYICTWVSDHRWLDWHDHWNAMGKKVERWLDRGKTVLALSYLGHTRNSLKDDAYFCYCSARLSNFLWSAGGDVLKGDPAEVLYNIRLGQPRGQEKEIGGVHYRSFEHGLVAVNPEDKATKMEIRGTEGQRVLDLYEGAFLGECGEDVVVEVPPQSGRVYLHVPEYTPPDPEPYVLRISTEPPLGNVRFTIDGIESYTKSGHWRIDYDKGPNFGTLVWKFGSPGTHEIEACDATAKGLEISKGYGSVEKLGKLMDPAEPTKPAKEDYKFVEWRIDHKVLTTRKIRIEVEHETNVVAVYSRSNG